MTLHVTDLSKWDDDTVIVTFTEDVSAIDFPPGCLFNDTEGAYSMTAVHVDAHHIRLGGELTSGFGNADDTVVWQVPFGAVANVLPTEQHTNP